MNTNFNNLVQFQQYFKDEETCRKHLEQQRWDGKPVCPFCQTERVYRFKDGRRFKCAEKTCNKKFTVTVGTIYENSKIPLQKWFLAVYLLGNHKKGISSLQLSRDLGITQKSAWFVNHRVREMLKDKAPQLLKEQVQVDESYVGGKNKNRHANKKIEHSQGRSAKDKTPVVGLYERNGRVVTFVVSNTDAETLHGIMEQNVEKDAILITDAYRSYRGLEKKYKHIVVKGESGRYVVDNKFHTQNIENFWSLLKRGIIGIYHYTSPQHLSRYCDEFAHRYNTRKLADNERFELNVRNSEGRLKYKDLIK